MAKHEYTPRQALDLILEKLTSRSPALADQIRFAINGGKDVHVIDDKQKQSRRGEPRYYRKHVAYTDEEALSVAVEVLEAHLIEVRMFAISAEKDLTTAGVAPSQRSPSSRADTNVEVIEQVDQVKKIEIELEPESVQEKREIPNTPVRIVNEKELSSLREVLEILARLTDFVSR